MSTNSPSAPPNSPSAPPKNPRGRPKTAAPAPKRKPRPKRTDRISARITPAEARVYDRFVEDKATDHATLVRDALRNYIGPEFFKAGARLHFP